MALLKTYCKHLSVFPSPFLIIPLFQRKTWEIVNVAQTVHQTQLNTKKCSIYFNYFLTSPTPANTCANTPTLTSTVLFVSKYFSTISTLNGKNKDLACFKTVSQNF